MTLLEYEEKLFGKEEIELYVFLLDGVQGGQVFENGLMVGMRARAYDANQEEGLLVKTISLKWPDENKTYLFKNKVQFKKHGIYHLLVKKIIPLKDLGIHDEIFNRSYIIKEVLEENAKCEPLEELKEYFETSFYLETPYCKFELNREDAIFKGSDVWNGEEITIYLYADKNNDETAKKALKVLGKYYEDIAKMDQINKEFAADKLLKDANKWRVEDANGVYLDEITKEKFMERISLYEIIIENSGRTYFCYYADGMFTDHAITIEVLANGKYKKATIE